VARYLGIKKALAYITNVLAINLILLNIIAYRCDVIQNKQRKLMEVKTGIVQRK
jgi:hypothetical protein